MRRASMLLLALSACHDFAADARLCRDAGRCGVGLSGGGVVPQFSNLDFGRVAKSDLVTLPAYGLVDTAVYYTAKTFDIALNVGNLLDRRYIVSAHGSSNNLNLPGAPRNLQLSLRTHF